MIYWPSIYSPLGHDIQINTRVICSSHSNARSLSEYNDISICICIFLLFVAQQLLEKNNQTSLEKENLQFVQVD